MITYEPYLGGIRVRVNKKITGAIKTVDQGFQYQPTGSKLVGEVFATVDAVKRSLEN
jgi:hypothetical protein